MKIIEYTTIGLQIPEWLQEFREHLVDDEIPEHGDSHASSSHEISSEPTFKRREDLCKQDLATQWIQSYPCKTKTSQETQRSLQKFLEPDRNPKVIYTDKSLEFGKACEDLSWNHCTSTPHRSETNGMSG